MKFKFVFHYLDDLIVYSNSFEEHLQHLQEGFQRLCLVGLTVNPAKVKFATSHLSFLGHIISPSGVSVDPDRTSAIRSFPPPHDVKGVARFVGMVLFFFLHNSSPNLQNGPLPLHVLYKKDVKSVWGPNQQRAFEDLKLAIINPTVLCMADSSCRFIFKWT
jgi:hypothetical protein